MSTDVSRPRYPALLTVANIARAFGFLVVILGLIATIVGAIDGFDISFGRGLYVAIIGLALTALNAIILFAIAESINVIIDIEGNTRAAAGPGAPPPTGPV